MRFLKKSLKLKISDALGFNPEFNKKVIQMKRSWDEVETLLTKGGKNKSKGSGRK